MHVSRGSFVSFLFHDNIEQSAGNKDDLGNLTANEMYSESGNGPQAVLDGIDALLSKCRHLTVVTNEVFSGGSLYAGDTLRYLQELARINILLAEKADLVCEVVCGECIRLKGEGL